VIVAFSFLKFQTDGKGKIFMKHFNSIKKNKDFQVVYQNGKSYANRLLVMYVKKTDMPRSRIGISVSKKVGNSVVRHHITRLIRESFRLHEDVVEAGLDIVVVARVSAKEESYKTIESAYLHLCGLHNILKKESK
jgi:ribonuclease P protein component